MKPGWKTTEGWAAALVMIGSYAGVAAGLVAGPVGLGIGAVSALAYIASRTILKARAHDVAGVLDEVPGAVAAVARGRK